MKGIMLLTVLTGVALGVVENVGFVEQTIVTLGIAEFVVAFAITHSVGFFPRARMTCPS